MFPTWRSIVEFAVATLIMGCKKTFCGLIRVNDILLLCYKFIEVSFITFSWLCLMFQGYWLNFFSSLKQMCYYFCVVKLILVLYRCYRCDFFIYVSKLFGFFPHIFRGNYKIAKWMQVLCYICSSSKRITHIRQKPYLGTILST
jgi:hypothetical protein